MKYFLVTAVVSLAAAPLVAPVLFPAPRTAPAVVTYGPAVETPPAQTQTGCGCTSPLDCTCAPESCDCPACAVQHVHQVAPASHEWAKQSVAADVPTAKDVVQVDDGGWTGADKDGWRAHPKSGWWHQASTGWWYAAGHYYPPAGHQPARPLFLQSFRPAFSGGGRGGC